MVVIGARQGLQVCLFAQRCPTQKRGVVNRRIEVVGSLDLFWRLGSTEAS
jgi:hypothetical protein